MASAVITRKGFTLRAYQGDCMTMLCFDLVEKKTTNCVGFSIEVVPPSGLRFFIPNRLSFTNKLTSSSTIKDKIEASTSTDFAPIQKFRWLHVPSSSFDGIEEVGKYTYIVTPRYMVSGVLDELDTSLSVEVKIDVQPFKKGKFSIGFTRGFMISQAYARRFGNDSSIEPTKRKLLFDIEEESGIYPQNLKAVGGKPYSYKNQYEWLGWQARDRVMEVLDEVVNDGELSMDVFAYDLDEPGICDKFLQLAAVGRIRIILDNSAGHIFDGKKKSFEDLFEVEFRKVAVDGSTILRCHYSRQAHQKTFIVKKNEKPFKILTGATNLALNGFYVNANHVIVMENKKIAEVYQQTFDHTIEHYESSTNPSFSNLTDKEVFVKRYSFNEPGIPKMDITYAPHSKKVATDIMNEMNDVLKNATESVLFAVMGMKSNISGPVIPTLRELHKDNSIYSYGVTDKYDGIVVYRPASQKGKMVKTEQIQKNLPKPFNREIGIGLRHKIHHKFVIVDFKSKDAVVYCGSSNLALLGEQQNGDNLLEIHDTDVATAFAIEAIRLVDHFHFRASLDEADASKPLMLKQSDGWLKDYYKEGHMKKLEREYFIK